MIEQDLLGISVNNLIENYCVLYDKETEKEIGISSIKNAEAIDKKYGNDYEEARRGYGSLEEGQAR